jgi:hypothetical protein
VVLNDNRFAGDELSLAAGSAAFADAAVGAGKLIAVGGIRIVDGADTGNYVLGNDTATATADIAPLLDTDSPSARAASLPPVLPGPPTAASTAPPAPLVDLTLPGTPRGGIAGSSDAGGANAPAGFDAGQVTGVRGGADAEHVSVSLLRAASSNVEGLVAVLVPALASAQGFSFPLPAALADAAAQGDVHVTLASGAPLPDWLRYLPATRSFVAAAAPPAGALPIEVVVEIGERQWIVSIAAQGGT